MAEYQQCSKCRHSEIRVVGVDCPICFEQQRAKMQLAGSTYLHHKASESIQGRRAPSHMYKTYTRNVAAANSYQHDKVLFDEQASLPPLRKSELTDRINAHQLFSTQRVKPLLEAGAIPLHPLEAGALPQPVSQYDDSDVFFDDAPYLDSKYVFLNGEVYQGENPMRANRVMYGIDSPTADVHAAVRAAAKRSAATKAPISEDERTIDSPIDAKGRGRSNPKRLKSAEKELTEKGLLGSYRELFSSSGRCYRVVQVNNATFAAGAGKLGVDGSMHEAKTNLDLKGDRQSQQPQRNTSAQMRGKQRVQREGQDREDDIHDNSRKNRRALPQKPTKSREHRNRVEKQKANLNKKERSSSPPRVAQKPGKDKENGRLPLIARHQHQRSRSSSPNPTYSSSNKRAHTKEPDGRSGVVECKRRHVDSTDSDAVISSYSVSPQESEYLPVKTNSRGRKNSDSVVVERSSRPTHQPRKKRSDRKHCDRQFSSLSSTDFTDEKARHNTRRARRHQQNSDSDADSEWAAASEGSSWSVVLSGPASSTFTSLEQSRSFTTTSSEERTATEKQDRKARHRRRRQKRGGRRASVSSSSSSSEIVDSDAEERRRHSKHRNVHTTKRKDKRRKKLSRSSHDSSEREYLNRSNSATSPTRQSGSGVGHSHRSRPTSPPRPPLVRAVLPPIPTGVLPPFTEEMLPSTRYDLACPSPVARAPQPLSTQLALPSLTTAAPEGTETGAKERGEGDQTDCASPALGQARTEADFASAANPMRRGYDEIPAEPLQLTHFNDLQPPSVASSGPLCSPSQGALNISAQDRSSTVAPQTSAGAARDLDYITEHVLRVIRDRLGGADSAELFTALSRQQQREAAAEAAQSKAAQEAEEKRQEEQRIAAANLRRAELLRLRQLLRETHEELRLLQRDAVPLDSLSASLKFAFAKVNQFGEDELTVLGLDEASDSRVRRSTIADESGTLIYGDGERKLLYSLDDGVTGTGLSNLEVDMATLDRLLKELRERRKQHEVHLREVEAEAERQRKAAEEAAAARAQKEREEREQQHARAMVALLTQEASARTAVRAEERLAHDQLVNNSAKSEEDCRRRAVAAQAMQFENERVDLAEDELDARAGLAAMEAEEAEDFWDVASRLWQAAADEADEAERERQAAAEEAEAIQKAAAWQAAQTELSSLDDAARQRRDSQDTESTTSGMRKSESRILGKGKLVRSNLIPGQLLDVSETDGKVRLVGDPHVAAVEARARERRRADRLRQERVASAFARPPTTKSDRSSAVADRQPFLRQPSTVRINVVGSGVTRATKKGSRAASRGSSRQSAPSSRSHNSAGGRGGGGGGRLDVVDRSEISPSRGRLQSRSNFEQEGDLDLGVDGRRVGAPAKTRSRASSLASAGVPHMGGVYNSATPHKTRPAEDEADALASFSTVGVEY